MDPRLQRAAQTRARLEDDGIFFAPVRHHSPACAWAVAAQLDEIGPVAVLVEGPTEFATLLPALVHPQTEPPVAVLSQSRAPGADRATSVGFFPLAAFSPEWVAIRGAHAAGAEIDFIDLSRSARPRDSDDDSRSLLAEQHLAHSRTLAGLARREHCRDHDELWDHLFEVRPVTSRGDWRRLFDDVFTWSALARLDYGPEALVADGSIDREGTMAARIAHWRRTRTGPLLVVTGAFHTLALVEALGGALEGAPIRAAAPVEPAPTEADPSCWLIRYDFTRLDALNGYGAGMPSPGYHQRVWDAGGRSVATEVLVDVARGTNQAGSTQWLSTADVTSAGEQAHRLAQLRDHPRPSRMDVLDAMTSCFVIDDLGPGAALKAAVARVFGGRGLGSVPDGTAAPPVVGEARRTAQALRLVVDDATPRTVTLEVHRSARHRARSRFFALMAFLETGFAARLTGPDFVTGRELARAGQEWRYAWTPLVEAALIDLAADGATLADLALTALERAERALAESTNHRSAAAHVALVAQAAVLGLSVPAGRLAAAAQHRLDGDPDLDSLVAAGHRLIGLWRGRAALELEDPAPIVALLTRLPTVIAAAVPGLADGPAAADEDALSTLLELRSLVSELTDVDLPVDPEPVTRALRTLRGSRSPAVAGATTAYGVLDGEVDEQTFAAALQAELDVGADVHHAVRYLGGLLRAAPDLLLHNADLFAAVRQAVAGLPEPAFLAHLPDLRRGFTALRPRETARLAERVAADLGVSPTAVASHRSDLTDADLAAGVAVEQALTAALAADGLAGWLVEEHR